MFSVRFWGVRGSMPCPGPDTLAFGGNTACIEIRADNRLLVIDAGTGIRPLGDSLLDRKRSAAPVDADIFVTHTHWDHIMGFPMFAPLYVPGTRLRIRGPVSPEEDTLESIIGTQLSYRFWPVRLSELAAEIKYGQIMETTFELEGGVKVITKYLNHPILCLGFRFEYQGKSIVTAYDHEPFRNLFPAEPGAPGYNEDTALEGEDAAREENEKMISFFRNADILIHDAQYTAAELEKHLGWGHSSYELAIEAAQKAGVKRLFFFHHDPNRGDKQLEELETFYRKNVSGIDVMMAREGFTAEA